MSDDKRSEGYTVTLDDGTTLANCVDLIPETPCTLGRNPDGSLMEIRMVPYDEALTEWSKNPRFKKAYDCAQRDRYLSAVMLAILGVIAVILVLMIGVQTWTAIF